MSKAQYVLRVSASARAYPLSLHFQVLLALDVLTCYGPRERPQGGGRGAYAVRYFPDKIPCQIYIVLY